ncbi:MAG: ethanolamine utilization protein EutN [Ruminococcaceae bacterium]|nr:ethanolamine utilization protein EutN [Oscillospiraceae bacterium]
MLVGKVVGSIVSTRKNENLVGSKFMVVEPLAELGNPDKKIVAVDNVGAGVGEIVLVALGSAARIGCNMSESPVDAAIVGIVDNGTGLAGVNHS